MLSFVSLFLFLVFVSASVSDWVAGVWWGGGIGGVFGCVWLIGRLLLCFALYFYFGVWFYVVGFLLRLWVFGLVCWVLGRCWVLGFSCLGVFCICCGYFLFCRLFVSWVCAWGLTWTLDVCLWFCHVRGFLQACCFVVDSCFVFVLLFPSGCWLGFCLLSLGGGLCLFVGVLFFGFWVGVWLCLGCVSDCRVSAAYLVVTAALGFGVGFCVGSRFFFVSDGGLVGLRFEFTVV